MIAHRLRPIGWIAAVTIAALCFYLISSRVAAERGRLEATDARIAQVIRDNRRLQTELAARGSLRQLERWNGEVLALSAPTAEQYKSEVQLASLQLGPAGKPEAVQVALVDAATNAPVAAPAAKTAAPAVAQAVELRRGRDTGPVDPAGPRPALLHTVAQVQMPRTAPPPSAPVARLQRVALLDAGALGDIARRADREAKGPAAR